MSREGCLRAIRTGGFAALFAAGYTVILALLDRHRQVGGIALEDLADPRLLVETAVLLVLAFLVFQKSRLAATVLPIFFVVTRTVTWVQLGVPRGIFVSVLLVVLFSSALRATFLWHSRFRRAPGGEPTGERQL